jgi:hypothetical protein
MNNFGVAKSFKARFETEKKKKKTTRVGNTTSCEQLNPCVAELSCAVPTEASLT